MPDGQESSIDGNRECPLAGRPTPAQALPPREGPATSGPLADRNGRRRFLQKALAAATGSSVIAAGSREEQGLWAWADAERTEAGPSEDAVTGLPYGRIGRLKISRLICGGNLFSGFAHARDLVYVSALMKQYFTPEKILDTLQRCEENGVNTAVLRCDQHVIQLLQRYRRERGGKIQWIAQTYPTEQSPLDNVKLALDQGAVGALVQGMTADRLVAAQRMDVLETVVTFLHQNRLAAGVGAHSLETPRAIRREDLPLDFFFKTFNDVDYHCQPPTEVADFMKTVNRPWIAFKVLGAGAVTPAHGFRMALEGGADFLTVGMFDFQVRENAALMKKLFASPLSRSRPWLS